MMVVMTRTGVRMAMLLIMLPQQVLAVVITIRCTDDRMDMVARRSVVVIHNTGLMIELDQDHRAEDPIVEWACIVERPDPGKQGVGQVSLCFTVANGGMPGPQSAGIDTEQR